LQNIIPENKTWSNIRSLDILSQISSKYIPSQAMMEQNFGNITFIEDFAYLL
jgi:hypothetical protein